jgi:hypothetical protein
VSGPGDRASKHPIPGTEADAFDPGGRPGQGSEQRGPGPAADAGSWSSARSHMPHAREPGDLGGGPSPVVGDGQPREGTMPHAAGAPKAHPFEESDAGVVPEKSAKTRVTPVESMEERPKAKGNSLTVKCRPDSGPGTCVSTWSWADRKGTREEERPPAGSPPTVLAHRAAPLTRGGSPVRENRSPGSVRGAARADRH